MKHCGKRNRILTGLLVFTLIAGMFVGNGITATAADGTTYYFCLAGDIEHEPRAEEGTILYPGDVLVHYISHRYDIIEYLVYVDNVETQGTAIGNGHYEWAVDTTYVVTKIEKK